MGRFSDYDFNEKECENLGVNKEKSSSEKYEKIIEKYSNFSDQELLQEFMSLTLAKKKQGDLKSDELEKIKGTLSPYLTSTQMANLDKVIDVINDV